MMITARRLALTLAILITCQPIFASAWSDVAISGQRLTTDQLLNLEQQLGIKIVAGIYLAGADGCWMNLSNATSGCLGQKTNTFSRYGSGERNSNGDWNHYSRSAGMGFGGTADGCIYTTTGWSNC